MSDPIALNYGLDNRRRRRLMKRISIVAILIGLGVVGWRYGPHAWVFARERYWERACMNFEASPDTVVYERLPAGSNKPTIVWPYMDGESRELTALLRPYKSFYVPAQGPVYRVPICWVRFLQASQKTTSGVVPTAVLFCHQCVSPAGHRRLVTIEFPWKMYPPIGELLPEEMYRCVYPVAGLNGCSQLQFNSGAIFDFLGQRLPMPQRIFAGQPDPTDPSHFTIEYEWPNAVRGVIDGWLRDSDQVDLTVRPGPGDINSARQSWYKNPKSWGSN